MERERLAKQLSAELALSKNLTSVPVTVSTVPMFDLSDRHDPVLHDLERSLSSVTESSMAGTNPELIVKSLSEDKTTISPPELTSMGSADSKIQGGLTLTSEFTPILTTPMPTIGTTVSYVPALVTDSVTRLSSVLSVKPKTLSTTLAPLSALEEVRKRVEADRAAMFLEKPMIFVTESPRRVRPVRPRVSSGKTTMSPELTALHKAMDDSRKAFKESEMKKYMEMKESEQIRDIYQHAVSHAPAIVTVPPLPFEIYTGDSSPATDHSGLVTVNTLTGNTSEVSTVIRMDMSTGLGWLTLGGFVGAGNPVKINFLIMLQKIFSGWSV